MFGSDAGGIAMFSRSMSAGADPVKFWNPGMSPLGMPVSRIAARSARSAFRLARFGNTPGYRIGSSVASSGCCTYFRNSASPDGGSAFQ
jgi:hypothetical protein